MSGQVARRPRVLELSSFRSVLYIFHSNRPLLTSTQSPRQSTPQYAQSRTHGAPVPRDFGTRLPPPDHSRSAEHYLGRGRHRAPHAAQTRGGNHKGRRHGQQRVVAKTNYFHSRVSSFSHSLPRVEPSIDLSWPNREQKVSKDDRGLPPQYGRGSRADSRRDEQRNVV